MEGPLSAEVSAGAVKNHNSSTAHSHPAETCPLLANASFRTAL